MKQTLRNDNREALFQTSGLDQWNKWKRSPSRRANKKTIQVNSHWDVEANLLHPDKQCKNCPANRADKKTIPINWNAIDCCQRKEKASAEPCNNNNNFMKTICTSHVTATKRKRMHKFKWHVIPNSSRHRTQHAKYKDGFTDLWQTRLGNTSNL